VGSTSGTGPGGRRRRGLWGALALGAASAAALVFAALHGDEAVRPVAPREPWLAAAYERAAEAAYGARVLVVTARPGVPARGAVFEAGRTPTGWGLFPPLPPGAEELAPALDALAASAAAAWREGGLADAPEVVRALAVFGVPVVLVEDGRAVVPAAGAGQSGLRPEPRVPGLRVTDAEPVSRLLADGVGGAGPADPVAFAASLETERATYLDFTPGLWGGSLTVESARGGRHVFPWPAAGARVRVDGREVEAQRAAVPLLVLDLPAGASRVEVAYVVAGVRDWLAVAGGLGLAVALLWVLLALRPHPREAALPAVPDDGAADAGADPVHDWEEAP
jgi:hypothetical protein